MILEHFGKKKCSSSGRYIRNSSDILPNWNDMRSIADITKLCEIARISILKRLSNNPKLEEKERQIELQIQKEAKFLAPKAIAGQPLKRRKRK
uniref:Uncharacterized protein n=1 Tax=Candidatus Methanophagaceae archaeon ANME-1 ERB6 TaxID=2759912 RepID=A0A7G9YTX7_9EURY|nr:hypothetical protein OGFGKJAA_00027 [Methanosarcinales archaeon ANME-1 ERB6]